jgi:hypothetical protein
MLRSGVALFTRWALVNASPARRRTRVIIGGAACRGRYGPGRQSPKSPYKLGTRLLLATFPPQRNASPCCTCLCARTYSVWHAAASSPVRHQPTGGPSSSSSCQDIRHVPTRSLIVQEHVAGRKCVWQIKGGFYSRDDDMRGRRAAWASRVVAACRPLVAHRQQNLRRQ